MKDFLGQEIKVGDKIVVLESKKTSSWYESGEVIGLTDKMVKVRYPNPRYLYNNETIKCSDKLIVVNNIVSKVEEEKLQEAIDNHPVKLTMLVYDSYFESEIVHPGGKYFSLYDEKLKQIRVSVDLSVHPGQILNWKPGTKGFNLFLKVVDTGLYILYNSKGECISEINGYVPNKLIPEKGGYGDYIDLHINDSGLITNWYENPSFEEFTFKTK